MRSEASGIPRASAWVNAWGTARRAGNNFPPPYGISRVVDGISRVADGRQSPRSPDRSPPPDSATISSVVCARRTTAKRTPPSPSPGA